VRSRVEPVPAPRRRIRPFFWCCDESGETSRAWWEEEEVDEVKSADEKGSEEARDGEEGRGVARGEEGVEIEDMETVASRSSGQYSES
jgi:hypothetical protein